MVFERPDPVKDRANRMKHGISLHDAREAFDDPDGFSILDQAHSTNEMRLFRFGKVAGRVCTVRFVLRAGKIRILGAGFWRKGRKKYDEKND